MAIQRDDPEVIDEPQDGEGGSRRRVRPNRDRTPEAGDVDRGAIGSVASSNRANIMKGGAFAAVAAVIGVFAITQASGPTTRVLTNAEKQAAATPAKAVVEYVPAKAGPTVATAALDPNAPQITPGQPAMVAGPNGQMVPAIQPGGTPPASPAGRPVQTPAQVMADAARRSRIMVFGDRSRPGGEAGAQPVSVPGSTPGGFEQASSNADDANQPTELDRLRRQSAIGESRATMIGNRNFLVTAGTLIPCVLQTALNSAQPGYTTCLIPKDVYSENGRVVLMEKGTKVVGEYRGGLQQGQNRLFVLWTRAVTPRGVAIDLASPGSDSLGRAGFAGGVDTFFWARFGGALLLSLIDDGAQIAGQALQNQGTNTTQVPGQAADVALQNTINIRPVLKKNQGEEVGIFVAKDFNFADVYDVQLKR
ncbi:type IV secretion system protein VirB10 [Sphingomonas sp. BK036]|uniref:type IV secretion system protein VirB10 n=1 Tax=Sphingomonas sp. BK036 TaxID=2512122 RepID=UPI0010290B74|nr:type IV secretion system protein VirB10 [Sphingomonas sp. BK036]RZT46447.1 type IV secretion system protein VirB10 [Sphingomonas sp. BK036]